MFCSSSVCAIGVGSRLTVQVVAGDRAPTLEVGNVLTELKAAPVMGGGTLGFIAKRAGPQTGPGGVDQAVYLRGLAPQTPFKVVAETDFPPLADFRVMLDADTNSASLLSLINTTGGLKNAITKGTQANSTVIAQAGMIVPGTGGRKLLRFEEVFAPMPVDRVFFNGDLGFLSGPGSDFSLFASNDDGLRAVLVPGDTFHLPFDVKIDFVDRALLSAPAAGGDPIGLVLGGAQLSAGQFGPFVGTVRIPATGVPSVRPIIVPGQASPPALVSGTIDNWIDLAAGPNNQGALTVIVRTPTFQYVEQTAMLDLTSPDPLAGAALLLSPNTPIVDTASTAGAVPAGTYMEQHYDRIFYSGEGRMYLPVWAKRPDFQSRVALASGVQSRRSRAAAGAPLITELRALLITQASAPGINGSTPATTPKIQSIDKVTASDDGYAVVEITLSGTGVNAANNSAWYICTPGDEVVLLVREGQSLEIAPGVFKVLNAVSHHSNCNTGDGLPNSLGSNGTWAFQADLDNFSSTAIFVATIERVCPADLNGDELVEDADFVIFLGAYNILDCLDPAMAAGCPADLNGDAVVDDGDFVVFLAAYNELVCP